MSEKLSTATAKVIVKLEVDVGGGSWGGGATVDQVYSQALDGVRNRISGLIGKERGIRVIGEMRVTLIAFPIKDTEDV